MNRKRFWRFLTTMALVIPVHATGLGHLNAEDTGGLPGPRTSGGSTGVAVPEGVNLSDRINGGGRRGDYSFVDHGIMCDAKWDGTCEKAERVCAQPNFRICGVEVTKSVKNGWLATGPVSNNCLMVRYQVSGSNDRLDQWKGSIAALVRLRTKWHEAADNPEQCKTKVDNPSMESCVCNEGVRLCRTLVRNAYGWNLSGPDTARGACVR